MKVQLLANNDVNFIQIFGVIKILQYICIQKNLNVNQMVKHLYTELCMWLKYGLKAQKLLAQGIALGNYGRKPVAL